MTITGTLSEISDSAKQVLIPAENINKALTPIPFTPRIKTLMNVIIFVECKAFKIGLQTQSFLAFTICLALRTLPNAETRKNF